VLIKLKANGLGDSSLKGISDKLMHLDRYADLDDPELVKRFIAEKQDVNYKDGLAKAYNYYVMVSGLSWNRPKYNPKKGLPRPPTTEQVKQLIASASRKYAPIFKLMSETGASPIEVSIMTEKNFDFERNTVFIEGRKGHLDRMVPISMHAIPKPISEDFKR
jgi:integrase